MNVKLVVLTALIVLAYLAWRDVPATRRSPTKGKLWTLFVAAILGGIAPGSGVTVLAFPRSLAGWRVNRSR